MHYFQQRYLRENQTFPAYTGLWTIDLPNKGLLSGIELRVHGYNDLGGFADPDTWLHDRITKIEVIVNGSQVVKSYDARQLLALMLFKKTPHYSHDYKNMHGGAAEEFWYINLGRHYHDLEYMLDLGQVNDPELRIEYNFGLGDLFGWECGHAMNEDYLPQLSVVCHMLRDTTLVPKGYIKTSEIYRFQNASQHQENMTIARGPTYSNLYLQSWWRNMGLGNVIEHYEVNFNSDDIIPIRSEVQELLAAQVRMYGLQEMAQKFYGTSPNAYPYPMEVGKLSGELGLNLAEAILRELDLWGCAQPVAFRDASTGLAMAGTCLMDIVIRGAFPFAMAAIPLFDPWDPDTWVDSSKLGDFWLRVEQPVIATPAGVMKLLGDEVVTRYVTPSWP